MSGTATYNRRQVLGTLAAVGATATGLAGLRFAIARGEPRIVVIGAGPGGATVAGQLKRVAPDLNVTLIDRDARYTTCFYSNHYIAGLRTFDSITHSFAGLKKLGIAVRRGTVRAIDLKKRIVQFGKVQEVAYDILVVAPGIAIDYDSIRGYSEDVARQMPHAWQGGLQSKLLRARLEDMADGGTVVIASPKLPYRCPPGPYERACLIAHYLKTHKPKSKLVILDAKLSFSKQPVFEEAFARYYKDIIEVHLSNDIDDFGVSRVDVRTGEVYTPAGLTVKADVANIIPRQTAGAIARDAGFADGDWCPVQPDTFRSAIHDDVYVLGDAAIANAMPKSAFSAHSQAQVVTADILKRLDLKGADPVTLANTCWSMLAPEDSVKIGAHYRPGEINGSEQLIAEDPFVSKRGEPAELRKQNYEDSLAWYATVTQSVFPARGG